MKDATRSSYVAAIHRAVRRVVDGLDDAVDLGALAREAALSPLHFHRIFRGFVGETAVELHRRLRLERAAWRLGTADDPVTRVAFDAGYETHESFTRAFRDAYGCPPSEFRARPASRRPRPELAAPNGVHFAPSRQEITIQLTEEALFMDVHIETLAERRVAAVAHRGPYNTIGAAFERLDALARAAGLADRPDCTLVALYHDDPDATPAAELRSEAGLVVPEGVALPAGLHETRIAAGRYARTTHVGPYSGLGDVWARFMGQWLPRSGRRLGAGVSYEHYLNTPMTAPPGELRTDVYIPLEA